MDATEYKYLEDTLAGRRGRDKEFESKMTGVETGKGLRITRQAEERRAALAARTPEEREMEQREFSLKVYGKTHMQYYARPLTGQGPLYVEGDQIKVKGHSAEVRPTPPKHLKLQFHNAAEEPGCKMWLRAK